METAIRWSPNSTLASQRFLFADVSGRSFNLGNITKYDPSIAVKLRYDLAPAYRQDVPAFRALDWAPFDENLVAVGTPSGETRVLRIDNSGPPVSFTVKYQRLCNAVAFGRTGLLATGLERVRNDFCLNVWDVNQPRSPAVGVIKSSEPTRKFASSEAISSVKFFSGQPEVLIVGVKGIGIRCYDLRENTVNPSLLFKTACVHNIAVDPLDENYFACAGTQKDSTIQIWDCRNGSPYTASSFSSSHGSSLGSGSDQNDNHGPVIAYPDVFSNNQTISGKAGTSGTLWSLRYCKGKSGFLGALASNGDFRVFETQKVFGDEYNTQQYAALNRMADGTSSRIFTRRVHRVERAFDVARYQRPEKERIVSFDFTNLAGRKGMPTAMFLRGDQSMEIHELSGPPCSLGLSASGRMVIVKDKTKGAKSLDATDDMAFLNNSVNFLYPNESVASDPEDAGPPKIPVVGLEQLERDVDSHEPKGTRMSSCETHEYMYTIRDGIQKVAAIEALTLSATAQRRCIEGYQFDCRKNIRVMEDNMWLQNMWHWVQRAKSTAADGSMTMGPLDLSYLGIYRLWNQDLGFEKTPKKMTNRQANFANVIMNMAHNLDLPNSIQAQTDFPEHRQLCLYTIGLGLNYEKIVDEVNSLANDGQQTKAASLAIVLGQYKLAAKALRTGDLLPHLRALSLALAGYAKGSTDESWNEVVEAVLKDINDPYSRAIFALVKHGDWHDVLKETSLPLRDRVGIALLYLPDEELTQYINAATSEAMKAGDIEGIVLTGLTELSVTLFETYIHKFSDLQTAVLALSHACPRFFTDPRVTVWRKTYRSYMNKWRLYTNRALFDITLTKLSTPPNGRPNLPSVPRQFTLQCSFCDQSLDRNPSHGPNLPEDSPLDGAWHQGSIFGNAKSGTLCPKCGRHMPRCVICQHWLGVPDGRGKSGVAAVAALGGKAEAMDAATVFCLECKHAMHLGHAREWFMRHEVCAEVGCGCRCRGLDPVGVASI